MLPVWVRIESEVDSVINIFERYTAEISMILHSYEEFSEKDEINKKFMADAIREIQLLFPDHLKYYLSFIASIKKDKLANMDITWVNVICRMIELGLMKFFFIKCIIRFNSRGFICPNISSMCCFTRI